ncbi:MAG: hypothetical protein F7B06_00965 [Opitutae bacterium]|nr:hypothetical protein [Opitutae bacterium]
MARSGEFIGFPPGLLGPGPYRLPLLRNRKNWFALYKPPYLLARAHPWHAECPDLTLGIKSQLTRGKPELQPLGIKGVYFVSGPEYEVGGPAIFAKNKEASDHWRNALGSDQFTFSFWGLSTGTWDRVTRQCHLPVARHHRENRVVISRKTGKKSYTFFDELGKLPPYLLWRARARNPRLHQVRIHAAESGLPILGDDLYGSGRVDPATVEPTWARRALSRIRGLALFLREVHLPAQMKEKTPVAADLPRGFANFLRKTGLAIG